MRGFFTVAALVVRVDRAEAAAEPTALQSEGVKGIQRGFKSMQGMQGVQSVQGVQKMAIDQLAAGLNQEREPAPSVQKMQRGFKSMPRACRACRACRRWAVNLQRGSTKSVPTERFVGAPPPSSHLLPAGRVAVVPVRGRVEQLQPANTCQQLTAAVRDPPRGAVGHDLPAPPDGAAGEVRVRPGAAPFNRGSTIDSAPSPL